MKNYFIDKISNEFKYKISIIFKKYINDIRIKNISIIDVKITKNFELIKIYFLLPYNENINSKNIYKKINILNKTINFIKKNIYKNIKLKKFPSKYIFIYDDSIDKGYNIYKLLKNNLLKYN
ncbi:ribosome-binding factor A [Candidatus Nardonella dryophthoridicola]|uniref:Ribosome-binding factor A n=1 Tax=endosymbiont of Rhynchophorus ferrugineus TaxID=1972133 RepID=A0A2Z5TGK8_9GAMM|nr:ribosome-binding factor A [Candidatus Nardonella dryophthoridicola]QTJ62941.1 ribosome-binding factor A [Candidatus Nardonella dryophthoridicola]BBA84993.1 ribosome-binding factor A [endosymbiont of Rhynchophorus ferrugineus]